MADQELLTSILTYHVIGATVLSTDLMDGMTATTVQGQEVTVTINDTGIFINDAQVIMADIETSNGVVHVIDAVLLPADTTTSANNLNLEALNFTFGPSPAIDEVLIQFQLSAPSYVNAQVVDIEGKTISNVIDKSGVQGAQQFRLDVSSWAPGSYFVQMQVDDQVGSYKFLKL